MFTCSRNSNSQLRAFALYGEGAPQSRCAKKAACLGCAQRVYILTNSARTARLRHTLDATVYAAADVSCSLVTILSVPLVGGILHRRLASMGTDARSAQAARRSDRMISVTLHVRIPSTQFDAVYALARDARVPMADWVRAALRRANRSTP